MIFEAETNKNISIITEGHLDLFRKLDDALKVKKETLLIRVNCLNVTFDGLSNELRKTHRIKVKSHNDNIICLPGQPGDVLPPVLSFAEKGWYLMSTYEEFMIILATASLIISILNYTHKK